MTVQSFSNAVHPLWRSYDQKVAHVFRAEEDDREPRSPLIVPWRPVDRVRCYPPLDKNGNDKNGERLVIPRCPPRTRHVARLRCGAWSLAMGIMLQQQARTDSLRDEKPTCSSETDFRPRERDVQSNSRGRPEREVCTA